MAYFSNGTEGMYLEEMCAYCIYNDDPDKAKAENRKYRPCPVYDLQALWNYDQEFNDKAKKEDELRTVPQVKRFVLDALVPNEEEWYETHGMKGVLCSMFVDEADVKEKLLKEIRESSHDLFEEKKQ